MIKAPPGGQERMATFPASRRRKSVLPLLLALCASCSVTTLVSKVWCWSSPQAPHRRAALSSIAAALALRVGSEEAQAFENAIKKIRRDINDPKKPGLFPEDIGLAERMREDYPALKGCSRPPNCFSSTYTGFLEKGLHDYDPWKFSGKSGEQAIQEIKEVVMRYPPGQKGIDGGGFKILAGDPTFTYVQFESLRRGYVDDVEFYLAPYNQPDAKEGKVLVRSASRQGNYDYGVNAARLNWLAAEIQKKGGWQTQQITFKSHPDYWKRNCYGGDGRKAPFVVRDVFVEECEGTAPNLSAADNPALMINEIQR